ncbi:MAG: hypothetical protein DHS20C17_14410 [Cyclobacteriaceae bacterium]|nr:MAG: hypothetical protein DHS20C17_14410 [Cyclobacteriaceae bacterium]
MFGCLFTLDYEIHGNGDGCPYELMVEPTERLLRLFDQYGAKLTIMADVAEIIKFKEYWQEHNEDVFYFNQIKQQLQQAILSGHDVQLHIHSSYFGSKFSNGSWDQNWLEYSLAELPYDRLFEIIGICKSFLEELIQPVQPDYRCSVFRAANWSMSPSYNIVQALINNGIKIDTSVWKYGKWDKIVQFDYSNAHSDLIPWYIDPNDVCRNSLEGKLLEIPIYCEERSIWHFITRNRLFRLNQASKHKHPASKFGYSAATQSAEKKTKSTVSKLKGLLTKKHAWKLDFNQCTGKQMIKALERIEKKYEHLDCDIPVVSIGHSKLFTAQNSRSLESFLKYVANEQSKYYFATFDEFDTTTFRALSIP